MSASTELCKRQNSQQSFYNVALYTVVIDSIFSVSYLYHTIYDFARYLLIISISILVLMKLLVVNVITICYYADTDDGTPYKSVPVIVNDDGHPLNVSLSEARDIVMLDGHVLITLPVTAGNTLLLKIAPLEGLIDTSFVSSHLLGEELLAGSTRDCLYQVTVINDNAGQGLINLCNSLVRI